MASKPITIVPNNLGDNDDDEAPHPYTSRPITEVQPKKLGQDDYDGGRAWLVMIAGFFSCAWVFGVELNFTVYFQPFMEEFGKTHSDSDIGLIASLSYGTLFLSGPFASLLIARIGTMWAMQIASLLVSLGFFASRFATDVYFLYISYGFLIGSGMGIAFLSGYAILKDYFKKHMRLAAIVVSIGGGFGMTIFTYIFQFQLEYYNGWRDSMLINSALSLNLSVLGLIMRPKPRDPVIRVPTLSEMMGTHVLKSLNFQLHVWHCVLWNIGLTIVFVMLTDYLVPAKSMVKDTALLVSFFIGLSNMIGRILSVPLERFFNPMRTYVVMTIFMGLFEMLLPAGMDLAGLSVIGVILGGSFGIMICYLVPVVGELVGYEHLTPALGYSNFGQGVGGLIGPPLMGLIKEGDKFIVGGFIVILSGVLMGLSVWRHWKETNISNQHTALASVNVDNSLLDHHENQNRSSGISA